MTSYQYTALIATLIAGLSTGLGALPIYLKKDFSKSNLDIGMGFSAGVMLVASFLSLIIPGLDEAKVQFGPLWGLLPVILGIFLGYLSIIIIHDFIPHEHLFKANDMSHRDKLSRTTLIILAIALHNFPEGLAVGVGFGNNDQSSAVLLAGAIALQNMPEGLVVAIGLLSEGASKNKAFMMAMLSGLIEPIAAAIGYFFTKISILTLPISLGFAGGAMLFVICQEIFPEIFRQGHERKTTFGVIVGITLMISFDYLFAG